jgi:hypothetical protein
MGFFISAAGVPRHGGGGCRAEGGTGGGRGDPTPGFWNSVPALCLVRATVFFSFVEKPTAIYFNFGNTLFEITSLNNVQKRHL